jgi:hypothetical protein
MFPVTSTGREAVAAFVAELATAIEKRPDRKAQS